MRWTRLAWVAMCVFLGVSWWTWTRPEEERAPALEGWQLEILARECADATENNCTAWLVDAAADGAAPRFPKWLRDLCPEAVRHFTRFPYFADFLPDIPVMTSVYAAGAVCGIAVADAIASSLKIPLYLHAGSHLGAVLHGGPIPWDDDVDVWIPDDRADEFYKACRRIGQIHEDVTVKCLRRNNIHIKFFLDTPDATRNRLGWKSPYVDMFFHNFTKTSISEVRRPASRLKLTFPLKDYFPAQMFYFGGLHFAGPGVKVARDRYDFKTCAFPRWNHRLEKLAIYRGPRAVSCCELAKHFPFMYDDHKVFNGRNSRLVFRTTDTPSVWRMSGSPNRRYFNLSQLDTVEIQNRISSDDCSNRKSLTVVQFNPEIDGLWRHSIERLQSLKADIILLTRTDIGMSRTDQQHTARNLALALGMNYAWGVEYLELSDDRSGSKSSVGPDNFLGLQGNAILTRCPIASAKVFRDPLSSASGERRGGLMAILAQIQVGSTIVVAGSTRKFQGQAQDVRAYIGSLPAVIGEDPMSDLCTNLGLRHTDIQKESFWSSAVDSASTRNRWDVLCSNARVVKKGTLIEPIVKRFGRTIRISERPITYASFEPRLR